MRRPMPIVLAHWLAGFWRCRARVVTRVRRSSTYVVRMYERPGGLVCPSVAMCRHSFRAVIDTILGPIPDWTGDPERQD